MEQPYHEKTTERKLDRCPHCGADQLFVREQPPHIALRCGSCDRWVKWVSRSDAARFPTEPAKPDSSPTLKLAHRVQPPLPGACNHRDELDRLVRAMTGIERELVVIARALGGGGRR